MKKISCIPEQNLEDVGIFKEGNLVISIFGNIFLVTGDNSIVYVYNTKGADYIGGALSTRNLDNADYAVYHGSVTMEN